MATKHAKQTFAEQFMFQDHKYKWFDLTCLAQIDEQLVAKIEVVEMGTLDTYTGLQVKICNRLTGVIDTKFFRFSDYLSFEPRDRVDTRPDYKDSFRAWARGNEFDWYIAKPKPENVAKLVVAIEQYIQLFVRN